MASLISPAGATLILDYDVSETEEAVFRDVNYEFSMRNKFYPTFSLTCQ